MFPPNSNLSFRYVGYAIWGRIFSTSVWGLGMTCWATTSPTFSAEQAPASTAALTAPTSPRTITVTKPEPIFS